MAGTGETYTVARGAVQEQPAPPAPSRPVAADRAAYDPARLAVHEDVLIPGTQTTSGHDRSSWAGTVGHVNEADPQEPP
jgi:hypothetical protein